MALSQGNHNLPITITLCYIFLTYSLCIYIIEHHFLLLLNMINNPFQRPSEDTTKGYLVLINALRPEDDTEKKKINYYNNLAIRKKGSRYYVNVTKNFLDANQIWIATCKSFFAVQDPTGDITHYYISKDDIEFDKQRRKFNIKEKESNKKIRTINATFITLLKQLEEREGVEPSSSLIPRLAQKLQNIKEIICTNKFYDDFKTLHFKGINVSVVDKVEEPKELLDPYFEFSIKYNFDFYKFVNDLHHRAKEYDENCLCQLAKNDEFLDNTEYNVLLAVIATLERIINGSSLITKETKNSIETFCTNFLSARAQKVKIAHLVSRISRIINDSDIKNGLLHKNRRALNDLVKER